MKAPSRDLVTRMSRTVLEWGTRGVIVHQFGIDQLSGARPSGYVFIGEKSWPALKADLIAGGGSLRFLVGEEDEERAEFVELQVPTMPWVRVRIYCEEAG